jgi:DNA-binding protein H-NS
MFGRKKEPSAQKTARSLSDYSYDELLTFKLDLNTEIEKRGTGELDALKQKLRMVAAALGVEIDELFAEKKERKKRSVAVKYRDPDNPDNTWSGVGKPKKWLQEKLDAGANKEAFAIE